MGDMRDTSSQPLSQVSEVDTPTSAAKQGSVPDGSISSTGSLMPLPPDGGWGWVIVVASFLCNGLVDGFCGTYGILMPSFLDHFGSGRGETALAGSLMIGSFLISGPFVSVLVNAWGCRKVTISGSCLLAVSLILATFAPNISVFILIYGFMAGLGIGFIYLPSSVMVGFYFERRRALATGLAYSGAGAGILILAPLTAYLLQQYSWRGTLIIEAGVALQGVVLGSLMRPLTAGTCPATPIVEDSPQLENTARGEKPCIDSSHDTDQELAGDPRHRTLSTGACLGGSSFQLHRKVMQNVMQRKEHSQLSIDSEFSLNKDTPCQGSSLKSMDNSQSKLDESRQNPTMSQSNYELTIDPLLPHKRKTCSATRQRKSTHSTMTVASCLDLPTDTGYKGMPLQQRLRVREELLKPLNRQDIFYSGSLTLLPEYRSQPNMASYVASVTCIPQLEVEADSRCQFLSPATKASIKSMLDISLLADPYFLIIALANFCIQIGYFIPIIFIADYAASINISAQDAATLVSVIGLSNAVGRAAAGGLANLAGVSVLHLNNISLMLCGVSTMVVVLLCTDYISLTVYAAIFGLTLAAFVPLSTIFLVKYLGLQNLTNSYGFLSMVRGISSMAGAPLAGALLDATGSFQAVFSVAGSMFALAGLLHYLLPLVEKYKKKGSYFTESEITE